MPGSVPPRSTRGCFPSRWQSSAPGMLHGRNLGRGLGAAVPSSHQPLQAPSSAPGESPGLPNPQPCSSRPRHHGEIIFPQPRRQRSFGQGFLHTSVPGCSGTPLGAAVRMCPSLCPAPCPCTGSRNQQRVADSRSRPAADGARACPESHPDPSCSPGSRPITSSTPPQSGVRPALPRLAPPASSEDFSPDLTLSHFRTTQPPITTPGGKVPVPGHRPGSRLGYLGLGAEQRPTR